MLQRHIAVLGAGSWGTALAILLARNGHGVVLWGRDCKQVAAMAGERRNRRYLPEHEFPRELKVTASLDEAAAGARLALVVVPSSGFQAVCASLASRGADLTGMFWATKGFDPGSGRLLHEVAAETTAGKLPTAVLSGPTFANEIARGLPAAVSCASTHAGFAEQVAELFRNEWFRVYTSTDMIGVEIGGAVKNVLAIAAGIADGLGFGANTRAALITRGLREIVRLGAALGGQPESFMGLAGLGDLVLTCTDDQSRNRRFGLALARGLSVGAAEQSVGQVVEGVGAAREVMRQARKIGVEMPIAEQVNRVLHEGAAPADAVHALLARPPGAESE
ncbi:MAG: NAD(P)H-dependent glycerol-3-phosphate dehydrogenase [Gammaproteobacteria bacterium]